MRHLTLSLLGLLACPLLSQEQVTEASLYRAAAPLAVALPGKGDWRQHIFPATLVEQLHVDLLSLQQTINPQVRTRFPIQVAKNLLATPGVNQFEVILTLNPITKRPSMAVLPMVDSSASRTSAVAYANGIDCPPVCRESPYVASASSKAQLPLPEVTLYHVDPPLTSAPALSQDWRQHIFPATLIEPLRNALLTTQKALNPLIRARFPLQVLNDLVATPDVTHFELVQIMNPGTDRATVAILPLGEGITRRGGSPIAYSNAIDCPPVCREAK